MYGWGQLNSPQITTHSSVQKSTEPRMCVLALRYHRSVAVKNKPDVKLSFRILVEQEGPPQSAPHQVKL